MIVRFTASAQADIAKILAQIELESPTTTARVARRFHEVFDHLATFPEAGQRLNDQTTRRFVLNPFPYVIYYRVRRKDLMILRVRHAARRPLARYS